MVNMRWLNSGPVLTINEVSITYGRERDSLREKNLTLGSEGDACKCAAFYLSAPKTF